MTCKYIRERNSPFSMKIGWMDTCENILQIAIQSKMQGIYVALIIVILIKPGNFIIT